MKDERREKVARAMYAMFTGNDPVIHCNRFPTWDELGNETQRQWLLAADAAIATMEALRDDLCSAAYKQGYRDGGDDTLCHTWHMDNAGEGYQNWLANDPALSAFEGRNND